MKHLTSTLALLFCLCISSYGQKSRCKKNQPETKKMVKAEPKIIITKQSVENSTDYLDIIELRKLKQKIISFSEDNVNLTSFKQDYCSLYESCNSDFITGEEVKTYKVYLREINPLQYEELFPKATTEKQ